MNTHTGQKAVVQYTSTHTHSNEHIVLTLAAVGQTVHKNLQTHAQQHSRCCPSQVMIGLVNPSMLGDTHLRMLLRKGDYLTN